MREREREVVDVVTSADRQNEESNMKHSKGVEIVNVSFKGL
jgi:hypothetical protein